jgi:hypothetical protein
MNLRNFAKTIALEFLPPFIVRQLRNPHSKAFRESDRHIKTDGYIPWLCTVVGGWLDATHNNIRAVDHAIQHMPTHGAILEIGSFLGRSANVITYLAFKYNRDNPFFCCDPWVFELTEEPIGGYFDAGTQAFALYAKEVFKLNMVTFSQGRRPYAIEAFSDQFFEQWHKAATVVDVFGRSVTLGGPISFAYVDGAHTYEATKRDFLNIHEHLLPGGFIMFDDSADHSGFGSTQVAHEVKKNPVYELVFKTPNYFFRRIC